MNFLLSLLLLILLSCSQEVTDPRVESYATMELASTLTADDLGGKPPQDAIIYGDTLYVLTRDSVNHSTVELFQYSTGTHLTSFKTWQRSDEAVDSLVAGMTISVFDSLLCIGSESSRVDVFDRKTLTYKSTIGNGNWWGDENTLIVHSFALAVVNELLVIRDKHNLRIYRVSDLTEENRTKVPLVAKSIALGANTYKTRFGMTVHGDYLYVTDNPNKCLERFALADITEGNMEIAPVDTIAVGARPFDISVHNNALYLPTDGGVKKFDPATKEFSSVESIVGHEFVSPQTLLFDHNDFAVVEPSSHSVILGEVHYHQLSIYE